MKKRYIFLSLIILISCEQNELAIEKHPIGEIETQQINMQSNYSQQVFYNMQNNNITSSNLKTDWDLAFRSSSAESQIIINSSTFSQISKLENKPFEDPISVTELTWDWDSPEGVYTSTVFDNIQSSTTYVLDRGYNIDGSSRGYRKIKIDSINTDSYFITYAKLDNTSINTVEIKKDGLANFQYFSFNTEQVVSIEPHANEWDLVFTQYTHLFVNNLETPAYLVTGVLTNYLNDIFVAKDSINSFDEINSDMIELYEFSNNQNMIGYDWKIFDFESQTYTVNAQITYIIKNNINQYFKLHFIDFYNEDGEKGHPKFEIQEL